MKSIKIKPLKNEIVDRFIADNNLFAIIECAPINVIFIDNFINNINLYKDIFMRNNMHDNIFFSCKANKGYSLLKTAAEQKCGIEVSSYYELEDALKYTNRIIASGPAKDFEYIKLAIEKNVIISVDDIEELKEIDKFHHTANVMLRISNLINIQSRFGVNVSQLNKCLSIIKKGKINLVGFSFHINNYNLEDRINAILQLLEIINNRKLNIRYIDIGGGIPINYCSKEEYENFKRENNKNMYYKRKEIREFYPYYNEKASEQALDYILHSVRNKLNNIEIIIEPGRSLLNNCGISIYEVKYIKHFDNGDNLIVTNGNINCLSEQWFDSDYLIEPLVYKRNIKPSKKVIQASVAGNLCLEQDIITWRKVEFEDTPEKGDFLIYYNTAAYQMDSNESDFHKIPIVKKIVVKKIENKYEIRSDSSYDC